ncbi:hypothetical protein E2C01_085124 [Portunus trituberculatus]|uniref:Uncharacterized protein n=1 Tax=Portunus trituberculatus TaxID=210409 RepID=A0A5B7IX33_PORTR|nr:hypothetical protein [Portunus trituberculatus]
MMMSCDICPSLQSVTPESLKAVGGPCEAARHYLSGGVAPLRDTGAHWTGRDGAGKGGSGSNCG